ncbi:Monooxygenase, FAD-binding protein [Metarhizium brunneum]
MAPIQKVIVVGAGPTGLLLALLLAKKGITVEVVEAEAEVDQRPRGLAYGPSATRILRRAGVLEEIRNITSDITSTSWRKLGGEILVHIEGDSQSPDKPLLYPVHLLSNMLLERVLQQETASVHMSHAVIDVGQSDDAAWVRVKSGDEVKRIEGDFVIGCDGAKSVVRKSLFGDDFPGFTWDKQLVVTNVHYKMANFNWSDVQWVVDPQYWAMVCCISRAEDTELWRVVYGEPIGLSPEQLRARLPEKFEKILPGHPKPDDYEIVRFSPFTVHQRCVEKMRVGRVLLVGDAAHLCNPMGGLGLTGGISDVGSLAECLYGIHEGKANMDILDKYDEARRQVFRDIVDPVSSANLRRIWNEPESIQWTDPFFNKARRAATEPEILEEMKLMNINCDMTQHYNEKA